MNSCRAAQPAPRSLVARPFPISPRRTHSCRRLRTASTCQHRRIRVWALIGAFGGIWHPLIAKIRLTGSGIGQLRTIETIDGKTIIERLEAMDQAQRIYRYVGVTGIQASNYIGTLGVKPKDAGCSVEWHVQYLPDGQPDIVIRIIVSTLLKTGLASLKARFGAPK